MEQATFGGGCFWCLEASFEQLDGVTKVTSGYAGGHTSQPSYESVCAGQTGHAEVVQIDFEPEIIGYEQLLDVFFAIHDPTSENRQGADVGTQYRSVIFYHDDPQRELAMEAMATREQMHVFAAPIVTQLVQFEQFFPAENYHQGYFRNNPAQGYCAFVVAPKAAKVRELYRNKLKPAYR